MNGQYPQSLSGNYNAGFFKGLSTQLSYDFEKRRRGGGVNGDEINQPFGNKSSVEIVISAN